MTLEDKEKMRQSALKKSPKVIENHRQKMIGKKQSQEIKEKHRQATIKRYKNPLEREKTRQSCLHMFSSLDKLIKNKYCPLWTEKIREQVRVRDNHTCQLCGKTKEQEYRKLTVHHIHYLKSDCYPDLITLCNNCNIKANYNRDYWESYYMNKLNDRNLLFWTKNKNK